MKARTGMVLGICALALVLFTNYGLRAEPGVPLDKIGVVSVMSVIQNSQKNNELRRQAQGQMIQVKDQQQALATELETDKAALQTYVPDSDDYLAQLKQVLDKQAKLEAQQEYYRQLFSAKQRELTEKIYREVLEATNRVAAERGLLMVLGRTEPQFPIPPEEFLLTISSHKVLYAEGCVDLTAEVLAEVDRPLGPVLGAAPAPQN